MKKEYSAHHLDLRALAQAGDELVGHSAVASFSRLVQESHGAGAPSHEVRWSARGESREVAGSSAQVWLHLKVETSLLMVCQACLGDVDVPIAVERSFRFVKDEAEAEREDDLCEEDVLVLTRDFNLLELIEDEVLMGVPVVPRHEVCPQILPNAVEDPEYQEAQAEKPNPFAVLGALKPAVKKSSD